MGEVKGKSKQQVSAYELYIRLLDSMHELIVLLRETSKALWLHEAKRRNRITREIADELRMVARKRKKAS